MHRKFSKGFTLIELLIVIAIIAIIAVIAIPRLRSSWNEAKNSEQQPAAAQTAGN